MFSTRLFFSTFAFDLSSAAKFETGRVLKDPVCFVNGAFVTFSSLPAIAVEDPCTNAVVGEVSNLRKEDALQVIALTSAANKLWKDVVPYERAVVLHKWAALIRLHRHSLGSLLARESGKVVAEGVGECEYAARFVEWYAGEAERVYGDVVGGPRANVITTVLKRPVGVVGVITPWNFPSAMVTRAAAGALAAGCGVVLKPSELTPLSALALAQLAVEAGLPAGLFNVVTGDPEPIGEAMLDSVEVRKISFTGSTKVGKYIFARAANTMKRLGLELGGNAPFIVFDDANLDAAVRGLMSAKFRAAGQACISSNRTFVHTSIYEAFMVRLLAAVGTIRVGNSFNPSSTMGALISGTAVARLEGLVHDAVGRGAKVEIGGRALKGPGYFFEPTVLSSVDHGTMRCCQEEIFGPLIPVMKFTDEEEVVHLANSTPTGLAAYVFTEDHRRQKRLAEQLSFGMVGINDVGLSSPCAPFGGIKESGLGRDGSRYGIEAFLDIKYVLESRF
ncbi:putative Aldehyde dehydrogenase family [Trypanosoma vivax]|nr:putative aldehyde dehydrogenase [Trypanosoma vivax]KAH8611837.1 putative Aldehyde dehydrogenase family [Trypanosoma vivax]